MPISLEWTVPYEETEFHIGVHNLPPSRATAWAKALTTLSARIIDLLGLLAKLHAEPDVLICCQSSSKSFYHFCTRLK